MECLQRAAATVQQTVEALRRHAVRTAMAAQSVATTQALKVLRLVGAVAQARAGDDTDSDGNAEGVAALSRNDDRAVTTPTTMTMLRKRVVTAARQRAATATAMTS